MNYLSIGVKYHAFISTEVLLIGPFVTLFSCRFYQKLEMRSSEDHILSLQSDYSALHKDNAAKIPHNEAYSVAYSLVYDT